MNILKKFFANFLKIPLYRIPLIILVASVIYGLFYFFGNVFDFKSFIQYLIYTFLYWQGNYSFSKTIHETYPSIDYTKPKIFLHISFAFVYAIIVVVLINFLLYNLQSPFKVMLGEFLIGFGVTIFISLIYLSAEYFLLFKESMQEKEALKRAQIENELKVLSSQINPHFLFNSLNTLMSIIPEDTQLALDFTRKFSDVYRYVLQSKNQDLVSLQEELKFVDSYIFLMKIRYGDNLNIQNEIPAEAMNKKVPPLALQMIVENATKHNTISSIKNLHIKLSYESPDQLVVWNNCNLKMQTEAGTGTGLENIRRRYHYLADKDIEVNPSEDEFTVKLPLLNVEKYEINHH